MGMTKRRMASLGCVAFVAFGLCGSVRAEETPGAPSQPVANAGQTAGIDPAAPEFVSPAQRKAAAALLKKHQEAVSTSAQGLVQVEGLVADGGIVVRLNGRFRNTMVARTDSGVLKTDCGGGGSLDGTHAPLRAERAKE